MFCQWFLFILEIIFIYQIYLYDFSNGFGFTREKWEDPLIRGRMMMSSFDESFY